MTTNAGRFTIIGALPPSASVSVFNPGTRVLASLFTDNINGVAASNPVVVSTFGDIGFFAVPGPYDLSIPTGDETRTVTITVAPDPSEDWPGT